MTGSPFLTVLLVEDSVPIRHRLAALFCESPLIRIVGEAGTIDEAHYLLRVCQPDVAVLDVELPDGSGLELARQIRQRMPACRVLMLTNHDCEEYRDYCREFGVTDYFNKSTEFDRAAQRLHELAQAK